MFEPCYILNKTLLDNIVLIRQIIGTLNEKKFPRLIFAEFEKEARAISAYASTSIEGNPLALTDVKRVLKTHPKHIRDTEREVINYNQALIYLNSISKKKSQSVTKNLLCLIQKVVTHGLINKKNNGIMRKDPVVVNNPKTRTITYIPPDAKDIIHLTKELLAFLKKEHDNLDPLILAGIFHKQFVIIHPFMDGNGRTARLVTKYLLARMGLDTFSLFSFENYYNKNITKYFEHVGVNGDYYEMAKNIDFTKWLIYFTDGIIDELLRVQKLLARSDVNHRILPHEKTIIAYVKKYGSISESSYATMTSRARSTRILDFKRLIEKNILERYGNGKATYYVLLLE